MTVQVLKLVTNRFSDFCLTSNDLRLHQFQNQMGNSFSDSNGFCSTENGLLIKKRKTLDSLPNELLATIFQHVLDDGISVPAPRRYEDMSKPLGLRERRWFIPVHSWAQTCKKFRQIGLPMLWRKVKLEEVGDVKHYDRFLETVPLSIETYGFHIKTFSFRWIWEDEYNYDGLFKEALKQQVELEDPFNHDNYDYHPVFEDSKDMIDALGRILSRMPNLKRLEWGSYIMPLPKSLAFKIEKVCPFLETVEITQELIHREACTSVVPGLTKGLKRLQAEDWPTGAQMPNNEDSEYWIRFDENQPFCIAMNEPDQVLYEHGKNCVHWITYQCWIGAQHSLKYVQIPYAAAFTIEILYPLWLSLELSAPNYTNAIEGRRGEEGLQVQGWAEGIGYIRTAILSLPNKNFPSGWVEDIRDILRQDERIQKFWEKGRVKWSDDEDYVEPIMRRMKNGILDDEPWKDDDESHIEDNVGRVAAHKAWSVIDTLRDNERIRIAVEKWFKRTSSS